MESIIVWIVAQLNAMGVEMNDVMRVIGVFGFMASLFMIGNAHIHNPFHSPRTWPFIVSSLCFVAIVVLGMVAPYHNCDLLDCKAPTVEIEITNPY